ncbi:MAG: Catabolite control protein A [bacterium ADurb.Bin429]|nr:MAG: Catabolite control protein A [bacterium ADurb.Bin429]
MTSDSTTSRAVTLQDIADRCGLSLFTVSLALRGDTRVKPATAERVRAAATELGYDPARNQVARRMAMLRHGRKVINRVVALFVPENVEEVTYYHRLFWGVLHGLRTEGYAMLVNKLPLAKGHPSPDLTPLVRQGEIDGIIVPENPSADAQVTALRQSGGRLLPLVSLIWPCEDCSSVMADDEGGMYAATRHLLDLGHREFLYIAQAFPNALSRARTAGISRALTDAGLSPDRCLHTMPVFPYWYSPPNGARRAEDDNEHSLVRWLRAHPAVTAVLGWNDNAALHAWYTLEGAGWRIPADISIIGFDDTTPMPGPAGENLLTTVRVPLRDIGAEAARLIVRRIHGDLADDECRTLPTTLEIRASTAPARGG